jgi:hypothetical protein
MLGSRIALFEASLPTGLRMPDNDSEKRTREVAHAIWEQEGRPEGRAERHWRMAEIAVEAVEPSGHDSSYTIAEAIRSLATAEDDEREFIEHGLGAREALQAVENALVDARHDHFVMDTERWVWVGAKRVR